LVLVILAVIWAAVLLPPFLQNRSESRPADSISAFRSQLNVLERRSVGMHGGQGTSGQPARPVAPSATFSGVPSRSFDRARLARTEAKKRRRDILVTLLAAAGITLVLTVLMPQVLPLHLAIDVLLAAYVALLVRHKKLAEERAMKVRAMAPARARRQAAAAVPAGRPVPALRPVAVN
jgi:hypothetical protein